MAVFVSASDESSGANHLSDFQCSGFFAPETDWSRFFVPAWHERVLDGPPKIEYLHVTEMRSRSWREKNRLTERDAENRLDEASSVIATMGSLYPVKINIAGALFRKLYAPHDFLAASGGRKRFEPDYLAFVAYAYAVLKRISIKHPDAEKVDFIVEVKSSVTKHIGELYESLPDALQHIGHPELIPLLGKFIPATKERVPLQAADFLCWHSQRADAGTLEPNDVRRWNPMAGKTGFHFNMPTNVLTELAEAFAKHGAQNETPERIRKVRQNDGRYAQRFHTRDKGQARRREDSKKAEG